KLNTVKNVPKLVSIMPKTNFKVLSGMGCSGACTRVPTPITSTPAAAAPRAAVPMAPAPLPPKERKGDFKAFQQHPLVGEEHPECIEAGIDGFPSCACLCHVTESPV